MLDLVNRHLALPLLAWKRGSRHLHYLRDLEQSQYDSPSTIRATQRERLVAMLHHAYATVPYYQRTWQAAGVHPSDVKTIDDLQYFPIVTKADLRRHAGEMVSTSFDAATLRVKTTSGSTGVPLHIRIDEPAVQWKYACTLRADQWSGWRLGQRVAKVWGNPDYRRFGWRGRVLNRFVDRAVHLDTCLLTADRLREFVARIRRHRPGLIFGHAHSLYLLACQLKKAGIDDVRPNGVLSTAMPLHEWQRTVIEEVFGVPATNRYGCEEVSLIACECERHRGLHVASESVLTEVMPQNGSDGQASDATLSGRLLLTDLLNKAMPLIRYQVGDVVTASTRACPCGRGLPLLEMIEGRDADYVVTPSGAFISGISLTENFAMHIRGAAQVQIVQETLTYLRIRMVKDAAFTDRSHAEIAALVHETFGPTMRYEVEFVDGIPQEPSGKYRFCISNVAREHLHALSM